MVVTHHAPHRNSLAPRYAAEWASGGYITEMLPEFFEVPVLWVHGHTHDSFDYVVNGARVLCNPRGYAKDGVNENALFDAGLTVEVR